MRLGLPSQSSSQAKHISLFHVMEKWSWVALGGIKSSEEGHCLLPTRHPGAWDGHRGMPGRGNISSPPHQRGLFLPKRMRPGAQRDPGRSRQVWNTLCSSLCLPHSHNGAEPSSYQGWLLLLSPPRAAALPLPTVPELTASLESPGGDPGGECQAQSSHQHPSGRASSLLSALPFRA